jgi:Synergist-CTERM protein sorting domain-containing protein
MRKYTAIISSIMLLLVMTTGAFAADRWLSGKWSYQLWGEGVVGTELTRIKESGTLKIYSDGYHSDEYLRRYSINGKGEINPSGANEVEKYSISCGRYFGNSEYYKPGELVLFSYTERINGENVTFLWEMRQTGKHEASGKVRVVFEDRGGFINADMRASRDKLDDYFFNLGAGCNSGFGALLLLSAVPLLSVRRRKNITAKG